MPFDEVQIETTNPRHFYDIALLVDSVDFLKWLEVVRAKLGIAEPFPDYMSFYSHLHEKKEERLDFLEKEIVRIRSFSGRSPNFDKVIEYAIGLGRVPKNLYSPCYFETILDCADPDNFELNKHAIIITPNTTKSDVIALLSQIKRDMKRGHSQLNDPELRMKAVNKYDFASFNPIYNPPPRKQYTVIRDRRWYWLKKNHSYGYIYRLFAGRGDVTSKSVVVNAIKRYTSRLVRI